MCVFVYAGDQARISTVQGEGSLKALTSRVKNMAVISKGLEGKDQLGSGRRDIIFRIMKIYAIIWMYRS